MVHGKCLTLILSKCPKAAINNQNTRFLKERFKLDVPHRFSVQRYVCKYILLFKRVYVNIY